VGGGYEGDVVVPAGPFTAFVVIEAETGLEFAVVVFDPPTLFACLDESGLAGVSRQGAQPVTRWLPRLVGPFGDQPGLGQVLPVVQLLGAVVGL